MLDSGLQITYLNQSLPFICAPAFSLDGKFDSYVRVGRNTFSQVEMAKRTPSMMKIKKRIKIVIEANEIEKLYLSINSM